MEHKTSPIGFRTGITLNWQSTWFTPKVSYGDFLIEDNRIRKFIDKRFNRQHPCAAIIKTEIAGTCNEVKTTLHTARPDMVIGPHGAEIARSQCQKRGSVPLQTLDANVDYSTAPAVTTYGCLGIKVWIYNGKEIIQMGDNVGLPFDGVETHNIEINTEQSGKFYLTRKLQSSNNICCLTTSKPRTKFNTDG